MTGLTFREAVAADLPALVSMLSDDVLGARREGTADDPAYARAFAAIEAQPGNALLVACDGDEVVGCLQMVLIPGLSLRGTTRAEIEGVRVASSRRGEGIGARLTAEAIARARAAGAGLAQLASHAQRTDAHRFWRACGFEQSHMGFKMKLG